MDVNIIIYGFVLPLAACALILLWIEANYD